VALAECHFQSALLRRQLDLQRFGANHRPIHYPAGQTHYVGFVFPRNLAFGLDLSHSYGARDLSRRADVQGGTGDVALEPAFNHDGAVRGKCSLEFGTLFHEGLLLTRGARVLRVVHAFLPSSAVVFGRFIFSRSRQPRSKPNRVGSVGCWTAATTAPR